MCIDRCALHREAFQNHFILNPPIRRSTLPIMKTFAVAVVAACALTAGARAQETCDLSQDVLDSIDFKTFDESCKVLATDASFEQCDTCVASLLSDFLFPLYPSLGLEFEDFPKSPAILAQQLLSGEFDIASAFDTEGPCSAELEAMAEEANVDPQSLFTGIIGCDTSKGWGPNVISAVTEYYPDFVAAPSK